MMCFEEGCECLATYLPKVCVPARGYPLEVERSAQCIVQFPMCWKHIQEIKMPEFMTPELEEIFRMMLRNKQPPDFARAWVHHLPLDSDEAQDFMRSFQN